MFKKCIKFISQLIVISFVGAAVSFAVFYTHMVEHRIPTVPDLRALPTMASAYPVSSRVAINKSVSSAVRIISFSENAGEVSVASGTYFRYGKNHYVLTVRHGLAAPSCDLIQIEVDGVLYPCESVIAQDDYHDYAILSTEEILNRKAIKFPGDFVTKFREWTQTVTPLAPLVYTGFPNTIGPVTLAGRVMGISADEYVYYNSYAWSGSSGSGVFNAKGKLMGYIVAIDVGRTEYGIDVLENVILVVPHYRVDWRPLLERGR